MDVRRGDVDAELHAQRPAQLQLGLQSPVWQHVDGVTREFSDAHGATLPSALALLRKRTRPPKRRRIRKLRLLALLAVLALLGLSAFTFGLLTAVAAQLSALDPQNQKQPQQNTVVYASDGHTVLAVLRGSQARVIVPSEEISPLVKQAIVAVEDKRFYEHNGVDMHGILRALWEDVRSQSVVEGGSTITQQYVQNAYSRNADTIARKVREAALACPRRRTGRPTPG